MFGRSLGTGDYGHLTIEHVPMLFRIHRLLHQLSNQGFEAAHKLQRQLYEKATSHDATDQTASLEQIFTHLYTELFPEMRYAFREAVRSINNILLFSGKLFYYQKCKWKPKRVDWTRDEKEWIRRIVSMR
ncbi:unnamed protein product [Porites evermanni]|uniref:Uncharacterized protein n=1 Tax=Porites evermanni TaxID=104178 RepID=A0ABN8MUC7_9CNID|nr:unnamed protein product [Porites evermanni]